MLDVAEPFSPPFESLPADRPPSAARLAAEAFFASSAHSERDRSEPEVVVRKSRLGEPQCATGSEEVGAAGAGREPRVFRLSTPVSASGIQVSVAQRTDNDAGAAAGQLGAEATGMGAALRKGVRRKNRRELHGEVTITRPPAPMMPITAVESGAVSDPSLLPTTMTPAQPSMSGPVPAALLDADWPRYLGMRRALMALQREAQEAKARELPAALAWIKRAIADYGVTPQDLGFDR